MLIFYKSHYAASVDSYYGDFVLTLKVIFTSHVYSFSCSGFKRCFLSFVECQKSDPTFSNDLILMFLSMKVLIVQLG